MRLARTFNEKVETKPKNQLQRRRFGCVISAYQRRSPSTRDGGMVLLRLRSRTCPPCPRSFWRSSLSQGNRFAAGGNSLGKPNQSSHRKARWHRRNLELLSNPRALTADGCIGDPFILRPKFTLDPSEEASP